MFNKKTIKDIKLKGKTVLLRADYNVPLSNEGTITDDYRIEQSVPTIKYLLQQQCKVIICSHLGRPKDKYDKALSLRPVAQRLGTLLKHEVLFVDDCIGEEADAAVAALRPGQVLLLENVRFYAQEEANDADFAKQLAHGADVFVQDGFGVVHRAHASTDAITHYMPSVAGLLLEREVTAISDVMDHPKRPLMAIVGGAKIADKIDIVKHFIKTADFVALGGAMANTFLLAEDIRIGKSKADPADRDLAEDILELAKKEAKKRPFVLYLPQDGVVADSLEPRARTRVVDWATHAFSDIESYPKRPNHDDAVVGADELILDIGPFSGAFIAGGLQMVQTVVWNGVMGVTEVAGVQGPIGPFAHGTEILLEAMMGEFGHKPYTLIGGGDTSAYIEQRGLTKCFDHVSTGGGASLDLMAGKKLPGIEALEDKKRARMLYNKSKHKQ